MGWQIVRHSFALLGRNLGAAARASLGPILIAVLVILLIGAASGVSPAALAALDPANPAAPGLAGGALLVGLATLLVVLFVSAWVAVTWHRYVLLEEEPALVPALGGRPVWPYLGRTIVLSIVLILCAIPLSFVTGLVAAPFIGADPGAGTAPAPGFGPAFVIGVLFAAVLTWLWLRFGLILPATAVGQPMRMGESWARTKPAAGAIFLATLILMAITFAAGIVVDLALGGTILATILSLLVNWVSLMVGISILTTLYGHLVEGREIPR
ncbi:hypothetical protein [Wenxinia saemankumensis]|uniref:Glycerophosphoryl diester phosphodiesterase membrane domain-containing protein n=1 Tax=Wenxinia saemankumensis TaxID=1447782 RepID=A0A1M6FVE8_9RHOB|nr:hypothetical protein [Wenxinia saemankumensis]SHJ01610.1 hypothetical protein SAMN05444417_2521 [Wenxinia saemankumensis]